MADVPGSFGWTVLSDKSIDFLNSPHRFVEKNIRHLRSRIFACRFLNKPTVFVCSNQGVREVLANEDNAFVLGYKAYMEKIYNENIFFTNGDVASHMRDTLAHLFTPDALQSYQATIHRIAVKHMAAVNPRKPLCLYQFFRQVVTEICLTLFLGLDFSLSDGAQRVVSHTLRHWQGIVSIPAKVKIPGTCLKSTYYKAMAAKKQLLHVIDVQRAEAPSNFVQRIEDCGSEEGDSFINNHLLLFTTALVPKALASILTFFAIEVGRPEVASCLQPQLLNNAELMKNVFREVLRLHPPFIGGRRLTTKEVVVDGYRLPADCVVIYMTAAAHRDPDVFHNPNAFLHNRWIEGGDTSDDNLFGFGHGPRNCIGEQLAWNIINEVATQLLSRYQWMWRGPPTFPTKYLPVLRPKGAVCIDLLPVTTTGRATCPDGAQSSSTSDSTCESQPSSGIFYSSSDTTSCNRS